MSRVKQASSAFQKGDYVKSVLTKNFAFTGIVHDYFRLYDVVRVKWYASDEAVGLGEYLVKITKEEYEQRCLAYELQR